MVQVLPRSFDNLATIQIKLKRHMTHKSHYLFETVRSIAICETLDYLVQTPLYLEYNVNADRSYFQRYSNQSEVDFIIADNDKENSDELSDSEFVKKFFVESEEWEENNDEENSCNEVAEEIMLIDRNKEIVDNVQEIAPGQGRLPVPLHAVSNIDELCFPKIFCGHKFTMPAKFTYIGRIKLETRYRDRKACIPSRLLFIAKKKLEMTCLASINMCLRKTKRTEGMNVKDALDRNYLDNLMTFDERYKILKQIRSSPSYWESHAGRKN